MQLKNEAEMNPRAKFHAMRKLAKASKHAAHLQSLATKTADPRTVFESEAYAAWMQGNVDLEKENWAPAKKLFLHAKTIYVQLGSISGGTEAIFQARVDEILPIIRFCQNNLRLLGVQTEGELEQLPNLPSGNAPEMDLLRAKMETQLSAAREKNAASLTEITFNGKSIPLRSEKLRISIQGARDSLATLDAFEKATPTVTPETFDTRMELFEKAFTFLNDASKHAQDETEAEMKARKVGGPASAAAPMPLARAFVQQTTLATAIRRTTLVIQSLVLRYEGKFVRLGAKEKPVGPADIARAYESLLANIEEIIRLKEAASENTAEEESALILNKATRAYFLALWHTACGRFAEAFVLLNAVQPMLVELSHLLKASGKDDYSDVSNLEARVRTQQAIVHARAALASSGLQLEEPIQTSTLPLTARLHLFESGPTLINLPPDMLPVPAKPLVFDLAHSVGCQPPDLSALLKASSQGSSWGSYLKFW